MKSLTIGQLARTAGVNLESIRFYEAQGLVPEPPRSQAGYRLYSLDAVRRIHFIKRAQELGFSLKEIRELLVFAQDQTTDCAEVRSLARTKVAEIREKIRTLEAMKRYLTALTETCPGAGPATHCSILESIGSEEAHDEN
ncbi:MAG: MerR family DNA-binding protein [Acidobacteriaceae bacterium]